MMLMDRAICNESRVLAISRSDGSDVQAQLAVRDQFLLVRPMVGSGWQFDYDFVNCVPRLLETLQLFGLV
jgi:hypothetical protein